MNTTTISSNHSTFRFLSLPRELRDFVYHYYATSHPDIPIGPTYSKTFKTTKPYLHSIFLVNKQLKHEYLPCLLKVATFYYVVASWNLSRIWNCYTRSIFKISPLLQQHIRKCTVYVNCDDEVTARFHFFWERKCKWESTVENQDIIKGILQDLPNLEALHCEIACDDRSSCRLDSRKLINHSESLLRSISDSLRKCTIVAFGEFAKYVRNRWEEKEVGEVEAPRYRQAWEFEWKN